MGSQGFYSRPEGNDLKVCSFIYIVNIWKTVWDQWALTKKIQEIKLEPKLESCFLIEDVSVFQEEEDGGEGHVVAEVQSATLRALELDLKEEQDSWFYSQGNFLKLSLLSRNSQKVDFFVLEEARTFDNLQFK